MSFITAEAVDRLSLRLVRSESLGIKAFGQTEADRKERDVVEFSIMLCCRCNYEYC